MNELRCENCGFEGNEDDWKGTDGMCPACGQKAAPGPPAETNEPETALHGSQPAGGMRRYRPEFTGTAGEYFRIWIVNTFLTIVTLGIYAAWAKVRNRRYIYRNTLLDNQPFEYTADPVALLKGNLIVAAGVLLYFLAELYQPVYSALVAGVFYVIVPFLIYKSLKFYAYNSAYRNIRFHFNGTLGDSYRTYLFIPFLIPFTLGLVVPWWAFEKKKYFFGNFAFGTSANEFGGKSGPFYRIYITASLLSAAMLVVLAIGIMIPVMQSGMVIKPQAPGGFIAGALVINYLAVIVLFSFFQQYIYSREANYCWGVSTLGGLRFESTLKARKLLAIRITNLLAIIFSLGLLTPWAKIRRTKYILDNLTVLSGTDLNEFEAAAESDVSAYGESAADFFDFEIGL